jgi:hypothetical protein
MAMLPLFGFGGIVNAALQEYAIHSLSRRKVSLVKAPGGG